VFIVLIVRDINEHMSHVLSLISLTLIACKSIWLAIIVYLIIKITKQLSKEMDTEPHEMARGRRNAHIDTYTLLINNNI